MAQNKPKPVFSPHPDAVSITGLVCMVNWDDEKRRWIGVVCEAVQNPDGEEGVMVCDVHSAETKIEIEDWGRESIATRPWEIGQKNGRHP